MSLLNDQVSRGDSEVSVNQWPIAILGRTAAGSFRFLRLNEDGTLSIDGGGGGSSGSIESFHNDSMGRYECKFISEADGLVSGSFYAFRPIGHARIEVITLTEISEGEDRLINLDVWDCGAILVGFTSIKLTSGVMQIFKEGL